VAAALRTAASRQPLPRRARARARAGEAVLGYAFLLPAMAIFAAFTLIPAVGVFYTSFFDWNLIDPRRTRFLGLGNYAALLHSSGFLHSLLVTLYFLLGSVPTTMALALAVALLLSRSFRGRTALSLAVYAPYVTPVVATSIIWVWMFNPQFGLANAALTLLHLHPLQWLQSSTWALPAVILYTIWHQLGFSAIVFLAGLASLDTTLLEAARIDGAGAWQQLWHITWPLLTPTTLLVLVLNSIGALQAFSQFFVLTQGGPGGATTTTSYYLYVEAFVFFHTGYGSAVAVVLFLLIAALTLAQMRLGEGRTFYG
jgi:multiple sugar transport system permease protein